jgi:hypothetical protein
MTNEAVSVRVPLGVYLEVAYQLRNSGDLRQPDDIVASAVKAWLGNRQGKSNGGYQWKELFLPDGTELRMRYRGVYYYAKIDGDQLKYAGETVSPRAWASMVTGTVRNPWRDIWIRRAINECWTRASMWRTGSSYSPLLLNAERRRHARRMSD